MKEKWIGLFKASKKYNIAYPSLYTRVRLGELKSMVKGKKIFVDENEVKKLAKTIKRRVVWKKKRAL